MFTQSSLKYQALHALMLLALVCCSCKNSTPATSHETAAEVKTQAAVQHPSDTLPAPTQVQSVVTVHSGKMKRDIDNTITLPQGYLAQGDNTCYPVVYLLHGYGDTHASWSQKFDLKDAATKHGVIIVCPDGQNSWYLDSPVDSTMQFETYVATELVNYIDTHYRTRADKASRAITGLSMGGHGALFLAMRHPEVFGSCGSMSGGVDITKFPDRWMLDKRLGKYAANKKAWADHSVINLVARLKPGQLNIIVDDGSQDFFYEVNMALHAALDKQGIKHDFSTRPGNHSWKYWCESLPKHLDFFDQAFAGKEVVCKTSINKSPTSPKAASSDTIKKKTNN